jgi:hypothetical protein
MDLILLTNVIHVMFHKKKEGFMLLGSHLAGGT